MAMSENAKKVIGFLKENHGKNVTSGDVAAAIGIEKRTVDGVFTSLQKKELGIRVPGTATGTKEVSFLSVTNDGVSCDRTDMSENAIKILDYLATVRDEYVTLDDLAAAIGVEKRSVNGAFNSLVKKGFCARTPKTVEADVEVKYLTLTDAGMAFDPNAVDAD